MQKIQLEMQAQHHPLQQYPHGQMMQMKEDKEHQIIPVAKAPKCGHRVQKFGLSVAIPGPTAVPMITRVKAKLCVEGFEMPDNGNDKGCVFLILTLFLYAMISSSSCPHAPLCHWILLWG